MKRFTLLIVCIFCVLSAGCPFTRINKISKMPLSDLNFPALKDDLISRDLFKKCTFYKEEENFGISSYDTSLFIDSDDNVYFFYESFCEFQSHIKINLEKKKIEAKQISPLIKENEIAKSTEIPLVRLKERYLKEFSADRAILLSVKINDRHFNKKCAVGVGDLDFELIKARNIFYLISILNANDQSAILSQIPDEQLQYLIVDNFKNIEDIIKVANANAEFRNKLDNITIMSAEIRNKLKAMSDADRKKFVSRIDSSEYKSVILSILREF